MRQLCRGPILQYLLTGHTSNLCLSTYKEAGESTACPSMQTNRVRTLNGASMNEKNADMQLPKVIGADLPLSKSESTIKNLLESFREVRKVWHDLRLVLASRRSDSDRYSVWNYLDEHDLTGAVEFIPYYDVCSNYPIMKRDCDLWVSMDTPVSALTPDSLQDALAHPSDRKTKLALFVTGYHPNRKQGNATYARVWLDHLRMSGYRIHVLYYGIDLEHVSEEMRRASLHEFDLYLEAAVTTGSVGRNENGLNVHVDDWCGTELLNAVDQLATRFQYDIAVINYAFLSAAFDRLPSYTEKVLLTHDKFTDRNRRVEAQGYPESNWISLDEQGERRACLRADTVVAIQDEEATHFQQLVDGNRRVCVVSPVFPIRTLIPRIPFGKLRIGFLGSSNMANEANIYEFLKVWENRPLLVEGSIIVLAGGVCETLSQWIPGAAELLDRVGPRMLGDVERLQTFFRYCDVVINPENGGTGIKIKTLEAMAYGVAALSTRAGAIGTGSTSRFHDASTIEGLADLCEEVVLDKSLLPLIKKETIHAYAAYAQRNAQVMIQVLGAAHAAACSTAENRWSSSDIAGTGAAPLVSIIVPVYNVEEFLGECLESVLDQDYENIEVLVVDDASRDNSRAIADLFAENDPRVQVIEHEHNRGLGPARNTGARKARGSYIFFLDSDDYLIGLDAIDRLVSAALKSHCEITVGGCAKLLPNGSFQAFDHEMDQGKANLAGQILRGADAFAAGLTLPTTNYLPLRAWGMLISRSFYERMALDFPAGEHEDMAHTPFLYAGANGVQYLRDLVVAYRVREGSISNVRWTAPMVERYFQLWRRMSENIERFALQDFRADAALKIVEHLFWKLQMNGFDPDCANAALQATKAIIDDGGAKGANELWFSIIELGRQIFLPESHAYASYAAFAKAIPSGVLLAYYQRRLNSY